MKKEKIKLEKVKIWNYEVGCVKFYVNAIVHYKKFLREFKKEKINIQYCGSYFEPKKIGRKNHMVLKGYDFICPMEYKGKIRKIVKSIKF